MAPEIGASSSPSPTRARQDIDIERIENMVLDILGDIQQQRR
jgi:hypothetical protein